MFCFFFFFFSAGVEQRSLSLPLCAALALRLTMRRHQYLCLSSTIFIIYIAYKRLYECTEHVRVKLGNIHVDARTASRRFSSVLLFARKHADN
uniref:Putative secreted protein n=1 Tax=Rhipicephalus microplus TaxID=6941 RepID=A0A6M2DCS7_RHIMP